MDEDLRSGPGRKNKAGGRLTNLVILSEQRILSSKRQNMGTGRLSNLERRDIRDY